MCRRKDSKLAARRARLAALPPPPQPLAEGECPNCHRRADLTGEFTVVNAPTCYQTICVCGETIDVKLKPISRSGMFERRSENG
jgi:hypothetical protein